MPIHTSWKSMVRGMKTTYCGKGEKLDVGMDFTDGTTVRVCKKASQVFYARLNKMGWDDKSPMPHKVQEALEMLFGPEETFEDEGEQTFIFTSPFDEIVEEGQEVVEETARKFKIVEGTLLVDKITKNDREYSFQEFESMAKTAEGSPIYFGVDFLNRHIKDKAHEVGQVLKAWVDQAKKAIRAKIKIWNTKDFPQIVESVKSGWGFSIGGIAKKALLIKKGLKNIIQVIGAKINHVQLLNPHVERGQDEAQVTKVTDVSESFQETFQPEICESGMCRLDKVVELFSEETEALSAKDIEGIEVPENIPHLPALWKKACESEKTPDALKKIVCSKWYAWLKANAKKPEKKEKKPEEAKRMVITIIGEGVRRIRKKKACISG